MRNRSTKKIHWTVQEGSRRTSPARLVETKRSLNHEVWGLDDVVFIPETSEIPLTPIQKYGLRRGTQHKGWRSMYARGAITINLMVSEMTPKIYGKLYSGIEFFVPEHGTYPEETRRLVSGHVTDDNIPLVAKVMLNMGRAIQLSLDMMEKLREKGTEEALESHEHIKATLFRNLPVFTINRRNGIDDEKKHYVYSVFATSDIDLKGECERELLVRLKERKVPANA